MLLNCHPNAGKKRHSEGFYWYYRVLGGMESSILMMSATFGKTCMFYWQFFLVVIKSQHTNKSGSFWQWKHYANQKDSSTEFLNLSVHPKGNNFPYATLLLMAYFSSMFPALKCLCFKELLYRDTLIFNRLCFNRWCFYESTSAGNTFLLTESSYKMPWLNSKSDFTLSSSYSLFFLLTLDKIKTQAGGTVFSSRFFPLDVLSLIKAKCKKKLSYVFLLSGRQKLLEI